jgi:fimbrial chaperone protein
MRFFSFLLISIFSINVHANLLISPTFVLFKDRERVKEVVLVNVSDTTNTYRVSLSDMIQDSRGQYEKVTSDNFEYSAASFLRHSPRQVSLKPGERQIIKLVARRNGKMTDGDYRSHLKFTALPTQEFTDSKEGSDPTGVNIRLAPVLHYSMPIVLQQGKSDVAFSIAGATLKNNQGENNIRNDLELTINKSGEYGVFGKIEVISRSKMGSEKVIGLLNGANIFRESSGRTFLINIPQQSDAIDLDSMRVRFTDVISKKLYLDESIAVSQ